MNKPNLVIRFPSQFSEECIKAVRDNIFKETSSQDYNILVVQDSDREGEIIFESHKTPTKEVQY